MTQSHLPPQDFKPLSFLSIVSAISESQLADLRPLLADLQAARDKPHVFDDETIDRVIRVHTESLQWLPYTLRQLDRWEKQRPSAAQQQTIQRIRAEVGETEPMLLEILSLAREIGTGTINKILNTDDFELGLAALAGRRPGLGMRSSSQVAGDVDSDELAAQVDARMGELVAAGLDDAAIFARMVDCLPAVVRLMDEGKLDVLCKRHAGLDCYARLIEETAAALSADLKQSPRFR